MPFGGRRGQVPWLHKFFAHDNGIAIVAARASADWFHELVVPAAPLHSTAAQVPRSQCTASNEIRH
jgi:hypothetical protein